MGYSALSSRAIVGRFFQKYEGTLGGSWARLLSFYNESNQENETYKFLGLPPELREWAGDRIEKSFAVYSQTIVNKTYEFTLPIDVDDIRRDKTGQIMMRVGQTGERASEHWEKLLTDMIESSSGAGPVCYDSQTFFDTDHSSGDSGTQENDLDSTDVPALNVSSAAAPTRDEAIDIIIGLVQYMYGYKDDKGVPMNGGAKEFVIMVPPKMIGAFAAATNVDLALAGARNILSVQDFKVKAIANPRLTASNNIVFLFRTDSEAKPFIMQEELPMQAQYIGAGSEEEFKNNRHLFGGKAIRNVGPGLWQHAIKATLS
jgi:phage major head subunit gpT-like protein